MLFTSLIAVAMIKYDCGKVIGLKRSPFHLSNDIKAVLLNQFYTRLHDAFVLSSRGSLGVSQGHQVPILVVHPYCRVDILRYEVGPVV